MHASITISSSDNITSKTSQRVRFSQAAREISLRGSSARSRMPSLSHGIEMSRRLIWQLKRAKTLIAVLVG